VEGRCIKVVVAEVVFVRVGVFVLTGLRLLVERVVAGVGVLVFLSVSMVVVEVVSIFKGAVGRGVREGETFLS